MNPAPNPAACNRHANATETDSPAIPQGIKSSKTTIAGARQRESSLRISSLRAPIHVNRENRENTILLNRMPSWPRDCFKEHTR